MTYMCKMNTYLMRSACFQIYTQQGMIIAAAEPAVMGNSTLSVIPDAAEDYGFLLPGNGSIYSSAEICFSLGGGVVDLGAAVLQNMGRIGIFGNGAETGGVLVKTIHRTEGQSGIKSSKAVSQSIALMTYGGMNRHSAGFIEDHHGIVFKGYWHIKGRSSLQRRIVTGTENDLVPLINKVNTADNSAVPGNTALCAF